MIDSAHTTTSQVKKRLTHDEYDVALICPLEMEMSAARYMLDEEHARLPRDIHDTNQYILGQLSGHNVVIASLPSGSQGTVAAATVAIHLARTFPSISLRLLVGIGGGVPSDKKAIRLGDVVVSVPYRAQGGVVEYDLGKQTPTGFARKGYICPPPTEWMAVVPMMQSDHRLRSNKITTFLSEMLQKFPRLTEYRRPPPEKDVLFRSDYEHDPNQPTCENCDQSKVIDRGQRGAPNEPVIFYGLIASGNRLMKHATERDKISKDSGGAICFEMEAAGLVNDFRCIVIRGISDYSDSHKNDDWQPYAAAAAAGLAKEILSYMDPISQTTSSGAKQQRGDIRHIFGGGARGGDARGGNATGGNATGGNATGGNATGGNATGGNATGGNATGGNATGGNATGGNATGGNATGGYSHW
jgi:nucleoside phosphorylase